MTDGEHFDEETLIGLAEDRVQQDTHPHLVECVECGETFREYRELLDTFAEGATWDAPVLDETPNPRTIANLRAYVDKMQREDAEGEPLVADLLAGSREEWMPRLMADGKYRTAGVVRKLIAATDAAIEMMPPDAVEIAKLASEISETLNADNYATDTVATLKSSSYRELGFALFYVGLFDRALEAQERAETVARLGNVEREIGRALLLKALILRQIDAVDEALARVSEAEGRFRLVEDRRNETVALSTRAYLLSKAGDFRGALTLSRRILEERAAYLSPREIAVLSMNLGVYSRELNDFPAALREFEIASFAFENLGMTTSAARMRWNIAVLLKANGDIARAAERLSRVIQDFESLGMLGTAAVAMVDLAEVKLLGGQLGDVAPLCHSAMRHFEVAGIAYSSRALAALALLREAAEKSTVPLPLVRSVRRYLDELPAKPNLEFAYIPEPIGDQHKNLG
jgi:tetratricopeptide (TPR) repeat protein